MLGGSATVVSNQVMTDFGIAVSLVTELLTGTENYIYWRKLIEMVLDFKDKWNFVRGRVPRPSDSVQLKKWERCNKVVKFLADEICITRDQEILSSCDSLCASLA